MSRTDEPHEIIKIVPEGKVFIYENIPWDNTYKHLRWYDGDDVLNKLNFPVLYEYYQTAPIRPGQPIRLPVNSAKLVNANYMAFQNTNFTDKWIYAFITDIRWINVNACEFDYEIDIFQTWQHSYIFQPCFVVREHIQEDMPGNNLVNENLELGEYTFTEPFRTHKFDKYSYLMAATVDPDGNDSEGGLYTGIYSGLSYNVYDTPEEVNFTIDKLVSDSKGDAIVSLTMYPRQFVKSKGSLSPDTVLIQIPLRNGPGAGIDGYQPKNRKLYTYPYNFLFCTNLSGGHANFQYEYFNKNNPSLAECQFRLVCDMTPNPTAMLVPKDYKGIAENFNEKITLEGFPQCAWITDTYKAWLAQNGSSTAITTMGNAFSGVASLISGNLGGAVSSGLSIAQTVAKVKATEALPPQAHTAAGNSTLVSLGEKDFYFYRCTIREEYARIIDNYFDMYGYATHLVKPPNIVGRLHWNYVETKNSIVLGSAPDYARRKMQKILDNGVTFWHDNNIGNYMQHNPPVTPG